MAITAERIGRFLAVTIELQSFMTFCGYLLMIACAGIWQKATSPLSLRPVSYFLIKNDKHNLIVSGNIL